MDTNEHQSEQAEPLTRISLIRANSNRTFSCDDRSSDADLVERENVGCDRPSSTSQIVATRRMAMVAQPVRGSVSRSKLRHFQACSNNSFAPQQSRPAAGHSPALPRRGFSDGEIGTLTVTMVASLSSGKRIEGEGNGNSQFTSAKRIHMINHSHPFVSIRGCSQ